MSPVIPISSRFKLIASVYLFLIKENGHNGKEILLLRRANTGYQDGKYGLPSGHLDGGEPLSAGMSREAKEEIGITIYTDNLKLVHIMHRMDEDERMDFFFDAQFFEGEIVNNEPDKCDDLSWFPVSNLPENTIPYIKSAIEHYLNGDLYSEFGW